MTKETKKILIVDFSLDELNQLKRIFQQNGFDTMTATDMATAAELASVIRPTMVLMKYSEKIHKIFKTPLTKK